MNIRGALVVGWVLSGISMLACSSGDGDGVRTGTTSSGLSTCDHGVCSTGGPLLNSCDSCTATLCALDAYCCNVAWDGTCVSEVTSICHQSCTAPPPATDAGPSTCSHPTCAVGGPLVSGCEPCSAQLCAQDPYCCTTAWDGTCVNEVASICGQTCN